jgi:hypothetical protein
VVAPNRLVTSNDFTNDKGQELLGKVRVEFADRREIPQTADVLGFPAGIARGAVRAGPSICRPRGYIGTALQKPDGGPAHRRYILVEAEEIGWIVLGLEFNQPCIIASERCPYRVWLFIADEI